MDDAMNVGGGITVTREADSLDDYNGQSAATGRGAGLGLRGPGGARPHRHATTAAAAVVFVHLALRWGRNWAAQWHLARAVGKRFRGCRAKRFGAF